MPRVARPVAERFWEKVDRSGGPEACWPWRSGHFPNGYGKFQFADKTMIGAHKLAFALHHGISPSECGITRHTCDSPGCCNPSHLIDGTQSDNIGDMDSRGRRGRGFLKPRFTGSKNTQAKLTEALVAEIKLSHLGTRPLARAYGVSRNCIRCIQRGETWKHVS